MSIMKLIPDTGQDRPAEQIAGRVRAVMAEHRLSSARVAQAIGISQPAFSRRYSGELDWSIDQLAALAQAFGMPFNDLCAIRDSNPEPADSTPRLTLYVAARVRGDLPTVPPVKPGHNGLVRHLELVPGIGAA